MFIVHWRVRRRSRRPSWKSPWPIHDILSLVFACARINHPFMNSAHSRYPHYCNTIARLLHCIYPLPDSPFMCRHGDTIGISEAPRRRLRVTFNPLSGAPVYAHGRAASHPIARVCVPLGAAVTCVMYAVHHTLLVLTVSCIG